MSRWEPNAPQRLSAAAVELFADRGYESVTVAEIAERAGLTKRTFFRHFADKREVLFSGEGAHSRSFADAIVEAPDSATPLEAVGSGLAALAADFGEERRDFLSKRQEIIGDNRDLQERELLKKAAITAVLADALAARGVPEPTKSLAAGIGVLALSAAYPRWLAPVNLRPLAELVEQALLEFGGAARALR